MDNVGTLLRTIQYKGRTASLIIKVTQLNGVQKQVPTLLCLIANKAYLWTSKRVHVTLPPLSYTLLFFGLISIAAPVIPCLPLATWE